MGFPVALTNGNYTSLRDDVTDKPSYQAAQYLSLCPNNTVLAAQVNGTPSGTSYAQITFDTVTSGSYSAVIPDMRVLISHTNSQRAAFFDGRVRLDGVANTGATSTILYINENSYPITDNDYIWVVDDYPLRDRLPAFAGDTQFKDYNIPFRRLLPYVRGLRSAYAGWIADPADVSTKLRIAFSITATAADSGATISTYLWTFPGTATVISGSTSAAAVTIDFASSTGDWCHLKVTDSNGNYITRHFFVHAASDTYPPLLTASGAQITGNINGGYNASIEAWSGVSSIIDQTFAVVWDEEWYNGTKTNILENIKFVGRFRQQAPATTTDPTFSQLQTVRYTIEGFAAQLARTEVLPHTLRPQASPTQWDEAKDLTLWRAITFMLSEHSTFVNLCDLEFDDVTNNYLTAQLNTQKGNLLSMVQDLAQSTNSAWEFAPDGATRIYVDARYRTNLDRASLVTVANLTSADWLELTIEEDPPTSVSKVNASGAYYDSTTTVETPLLATWPGAAQDIGPDEITLARQYLQANSGTVSAQAQLDQRAGYRGAIEAIKIRIVARFPDGYNFMVPSLSQWYTFTVAATDNALGLVFTTDTRWLCIDVKYDHDNTDGTKSCTATFTIETTANAGQAVQYPSVSEIAPFVPDIPDFGPYDFAFPEDPALFLGDTATNVDVPVGLTGQTSVPKNGNVVLAWDELAQAVAITRNFLLTDNPTWNIITPGTITARSGTALLETLPLAHDGTPASTSFNTDPLVTYTLVFRGYLTINVSGPTLSDAEYFDANNNFATVTWGGSDPAQPGAMLNGSLITHLPYASDHIYSITAVGTGSPFTVKFNDFPYGDNAGGPIYCDIYGPGTVTTATPTFAMFDPFTTKPGAYILANDSTNSFIYYTSDVLAGAVIWNQGTPVTGIYSTLRIGQSAGQILIEAPNIGGTAYAAVSTDYGQSFATPVAVGTAASGAVGVDTEWIGTVVLAAQDQKVRKATTLGGAFSDETNGGVTGAQPSTIIMPWYLLGSDTSKNTGANPDYLLGASALVGGEALWKVTNGGGKSAITPSTGGTKALAVSANGLTCWKGKRLAYLGAVSGTTHLYASATTGASWVDVGAFASTFILIRRRANTPGQCYWNLGGSIKYSSNIWAASPTVKTKTTPLASVNGLDIL